MRYEPNDLRLLVDHQLRPESAAGLHVGTWKTIFGPLPLGKLANRHLRNNSLAALDGDD